LIQDKASAGVGALRSQWFGDNDKTGGAGHSGRFISKCVIIFAGIFAGILDGFFAGFKTLRGVVTELARIDPLLAGRCRQ